MLFTVHLLVGLLLGKLLGNYFWVLLGALIVDFDHVYTFVKHKIYNIIDMLRAGFDPEDKIKGQRTIVHSLFGWAVISGLIFLINNEIGVYFGVGYLSHILLDMLDSADLFALYPLNWNIKGPLRYNSFHDHIFVFVLLFVLLMI